jgi:hypothetical protein
MDIEMFVFKVIMEEVNNIMKGIRVALILAVKNNHLYPCLKPDMSQVIDEISLSPCY